MPDSGVLDYALELLKNRVEIYAVSEKRRYISTSTIPNSLARRIEAKGGHIEPEFTFDLEQASGQ